MRKRVLPLLEDAKARSILEALCKEHGVHLPLMKKLIEIQRDNLGRGKQIGITQEFSAALGDFID